jgi:cold shock CspA family protein
MTGIVVNYTRIVGYGFIVPDDPNAPNYFVHYRSIQANSAKRVLRVGQRVEFDATEDEAGRPRAVNVRVISEPSQAVSDAIQFAIAKAKETAKRDGAPCRADFREVFKLMDAEAKLVRP